jgi:serine/threonine-protein kinase
VFTGALWWGLSRWEPRHRTLQLIDAIGILGVALLLNLNAGLFEVRTVAVFNLALTTGVALVLRSILVPSSAHRTLWLGVLASAVAIAVFFLSALHPRWPVAQRGPEDWPMAFQLISLCLWLAVLVATSTVASRVIYSLRREVRYAQKLGQYVLGEKIGEGGMGVVYRATHAMLRRETALKLLPPDRVDSHALQRFEREVTQTARLKHPNTVAVYDYGRTPDGVFYYAMEYLQGITLSALVEQEGPLPPGRVVHLLAQVCASLEEAHAVGLVHRDIKPANIMVQGNPAAYDWVKVLDFGLVKSLSSSSAPWVSSDTVIVGTPAYLSPEAITDPEGVDARSDLYAVAAVGYFLLAGRGVFEQRSVVGLCAAQLYEPPPPLERAVVAEAPELVALLMRGLEKSPAHRPQSAGEFRLALLACDAPTWAERDAREWWHHRERPASSRAPKPAPKQTFAPQKPSAHLTLG